MSDRVTALIVNFHDDLPANEASRIAYDILNVFNVPDVESVTSVASEYERDLDALIRRID